MSINNDPVFAAIPGVPNFETLSYNLAVLSEQDYSGIIVRETDRPTDEVRDAINDLRGAYDFSYLEGGTNETPGEARNKIAMCPQVTKCIDSNGDAILHYIGTDVRVARNENPTDAIRDVLSHERAGMGGGLVLTTEGQQDMYNFGPVFGLKSGIGALVQKKAEELLQEHGGRAVWNYRKKHSKLLASWPDTTAKPTDNIDPSVAWVHEGNLFISASNLRRGGYFDHTKLHEVQGLGVTLHKQGMEVAFNPNIAVQRQTNESAHFDKLATNLAITAYLVGKYGVLRYITS